MSIKVETDSGVDPAAAAHLSGLMESVEPLLLEILTAHGVRYLLVLVPPRTASTEPGRMPVMVASNIPKQVAHHVLTDLLADPLISAFSKPDGER